MKRTNIRAKGFTVALAMCALLAALAVIVSPQKTEAFRLGVVSNNGALISFSVNRVSRPGQARRRQRPAAKPKKDPREEALAEAAGSGKVEAVKTLLAEGVSPNAKDEDGYPALVLAVKLDGGIEVVRMLLAKGADVNAPDSEGRSALWFAAWQGQSEMVKVLLDKGADVNNSQNDGRTALRMAVVGGNSLSKQLEMVKALLDRGAKVNATDENGATVLMAAVGAGRPEIARLLLDRGANVNAKAGPKHVVGATALVLAVGFGQTSMVTLLLERGADVNARGHRGETALMVASETTRSKEKKQEMVDLLKKAGATK